MAKNANKKAAQAAAAPAPAAAVAPKSETPAAAPAAPAKPKGAVEKLTTYAQLALLKVGQLAMYLKDIVAVETRMQKAQKAFVDGLQFNGKVVAALKRAYVENLNNQSIPADTTFKDYFSQNAGGSCPGRVLAIAELFNALCLTNGADGKPLFPEEFYDKAAIDWLEKANPIVKAAQKAHGDAWKTCPDVTDVIKAMSEPGDALKTIKAVRARQKGEKPETTETESPAQPLTVGIALEFLRSAIQNAGNMLAAGKKDETFALFAETFTLHDTWAKSGIEAKMLGAWTGKIMAAEKAGIAPHMEIVKQPETAATPPPAVIEPAAAPVLEPAAIAA